ncbi:heterokaryon incompatibility protein-domain-containing protein [Chaetomium sp. MPI-CAGE-AT-0009]|nr:heterokaryon incompatibility protein-domain-containing protein [Chaetomium sp. MPI-CAGE-AT-0009]
MSPNSAPTQELCERCSILFSRPGLDEIYATPHNRFRHSQLETFEDRADCCFCRFVWEEDLIGANTQPLAFRRLRDLVYPPQSAAKIQNAKKFLGSWVVIRCDKSVAAQGQVDYLPSPVVSDGSPTLSTICVRVENSAGRMLWEFPFLYVSASQDDPCAALTPFRPLEWNGLNPTSAPLLKALLNRCETAHGRCQPLVPQPLPSRLVHVPSDYPSSQSIRLHVTPKGGQLGQYVALSYCWGGPQKFSLKHGNLDSLQQQATHVSALPRTLQDAIAVTYHLGFEYLWIDALCIIQDSPDDKRHEISQMQHIYANAAVTIAAATASSVEQGFLTPGTAASFSEPNNPHPHHGTLTLTPTHTPSTALFPINTRGWTYQEALLSPRLLTFGDLEPYLRCRTKEATLCARTAIRYDPRALQPRRFEAELQSTPLPSSHPHPHPQNSGEKEKEERETTLLEGGQSIDLRLEFRWPALVGQYTARALAESGDRPVAIAGVVAALAGITGDLDRVEFMKVPEAVVDWEGGGGDGTLCLSCRVMGEREVMGAAPLLVYWTLDLGKVVSPPPSPGDWLRPPVSEPLFFLVIARQVDQTFLALVATSAGGGVYHRRGLAELKNSSVIASKPRENIRLE